MTSYLFTMRVRQSFSQQAKNAQNIIIQKNKKHLIINCIPESFDTNILTKIF